MLNIWVINGNLTQSELVRGVARYGPLGARQKRLPTKVGRPSSPAPIATWLLRLLIFSEEMARKAGIKVLETTKKEYE